jgi:DNA-binding transcriptional regulator YbjK
VTTRRDVLLDAAIETVAAHGMRGLTHRAVDEAAGLPTGSTSNLFRSRDDLLDGIAERFAERERASFESFASEIPLTPEELGRILGRFAVASTRANRSLAIARYTLLVEGAIRPALQRTLREGGAVVNAWALQWFRAIRSPHPERDLLVVANFVTGLVLHELAHPTEGFDPTPRISELIQILVEAT